MTNQSRRRIVIAVFSLILVFCIGAAAQTNNNQSKNSKSKKPDCTQVSDADLVKAIYDKIKVKYTGQMRQINVRSADGVVTLEGWTTKKGIRKEIEKYAKKTNCVKRVMNNLTVGIPGGCGPGTKKCGDICIDERADCNISGIENEQLNSLFYLI